MQVPNNKWKRGFFSSSFFWTVLPSHQISYYCTMPRYRFVSVIILSLTELTREHSLGRRLPPPRSPATGAAAPLRLVESNVCCAETCRASISRSGRVGVTKKGEGNHHGCALGEGESGQQGRGGEVVPRTAAPGHRRRRFASAGEVGREVEGEIDWTLEWIGGRHHVRETER